MPKPQVSEPSTRDISNDQPFCGLDRYIGNADEYEEIVACNADGGDAYGTGS